MLLGGPEGAGHGPAAPSPISTTGSGVVRTRLCFLTRIHPSLPIVRRRGDLKRLVAGSMRPAPLLKALTERAGRSD